MAARKTPSLGNKPDKIFRDALLLVLNREDLIDGKKLKKINRLASTLVANGIDGDTQAIKEIRDTVDGRPAQALAIGGSEELGPLIVRWKGE